MTFETLPNEILMECFEYLNSLDIFYSFNNLNYRINNIIHHIPLYIRLEGTNKSIFDQFCTELVQNPKIKNQIYSLEICRQLGRLQYQIFSSLVSNEELSNLRKITYATLTPIPPCVGNNNGDFAEPNMFKLLYPNLQILSIPDINFSMCTLHKPTLINNLTLSTCRIPALNVNLKHFPMLKYFHIEETIWSPYGDNEETLGDLCFVHLKHLSIGVFRGNFQTFETLIKRTPNLKSLTIHSVIYMGMVNAHRWEHLITSLLPYLITFNFRFYYPFQGQKLFKDLFKQFHTKFWLEQHHWYTECAINNVLACIYTIPYLSNTFELNPNCDRYGYLKLFNNRKIFRNVTDIIFNSSSPIKNCQYYFPNVTYLTVLCSKDEHLTMEHIEYLKMNVPLSNLKHLSISSINLIERLLLFEILKQASQLSILTIDRHILQLILMDQELYKYLNKKIKRLYQTSSINEIFYLPDQENRFCKIFSNVEYLQCGIYCEDNLLFLLDHLPKLCTMKVCYLECKNNSSIRFQTKMQQLNAIYKLNMREYYGFSTRPYDVQSSKCVWYVYNVFIWCGQNTI